MAIKGSLNEASLPDIIQLLSIGQKTGVLSITNRQNFGNIYLKDGNVIYANIVNREDRLGDILVRRNRIKREQLDQAIKVQQESESPRMFGSILVSLGFITDKELVEHLHFQIEEAIHTLLNWRDGFFVFEPNRLPEEDVPMVSIKTSKLVMEAARRIDEWEVMRKKIPSLEMLVRVVSKSGMDVSSINELNCSEEEWKILSHVNNERSIQELADLTAINEFDVAKVIYGLMTSGLVEVVEARVQSQHIEENDTQISESNNLGLAFLKAELYEEAKKEFDKVIQLRPIDEMALFYLGLIAYQLNEFDTAISFYEKLIKSYKNVKSSVYNNLALAFEKLGDFEKATRTLEKGLEKDAHHIKMQINLGRIVAKMGDLVRAKIILENAKEHDPALPTPKFYLSCVLTKSEAYETALALLKTFSGNHKNEAIFNNQGVILEILNRNKDAIDAYKSALRLTPGLVKARQNLADIYYRNGWHQDALSEYQKLIETTPTSSEAYFKMGNIYMKYQERDKALTAWEKSLELDKENELLRRNIETVKKLKLVN